MLTLFNNPFIRALAVLVTILVILAGVYLSGKKEAREEFQTVILQENVDTMKRVFEKERAVRLQDIVLAEASKDRLAQLSLKINELNTYVETLEDRNAVCLSDNDTDRLRLLWPD